MSRQGRVYKDPKRKTNPWCYVVDVSPAGAPRKQQRKRGFRTQKAAQRALNDVLHSLDEGTYVTPSTITFDQFADAWLAVLPGRCRRSTIASYTNMLRLHVRPTLGPRKLQSITGGDLDALSAQLAASGRVDGKGGLSPTTVQHVFTIMAKVLGDAERQGLIARNPAARAHRPRRRDDLELVVWDTAQLGAFLAHAADHPLAPFFRLVATTGMRRGESLGLRWCDIDFDSSKVSVRRQVTEIAGVVEIGPPKTKRSRRTIDLDASTIEALRAHRRAELEARLRAGLGRADDEALVFADECGAPLTPPNVSRAFERLVASSGLPRLTLHGLRHSHASHLLAAGVPVTVVVERLGHSSASFSLDRYGHVLPTLGAEAAAKIGALVDGAGTRS